MKHLIFIVNILLFTGCGSSPDYQEIMVNKTVKVYSKDYHEDAENYTFKWEPPVGPSNMIVPFDLKNDMLIFSPEIEGKYQIHLSITDISDEVIAEEIFYYHAIPETIEVAISQPKKDSKIVLPTSTVKKTKNNTKEKKRKKKQPKAPLKQNINTKSNKSVNYTIQAAAWPALEEARIDQLKLIEEGIDAYIQRHYRSDRDEVWYRVRVGNFTSKANAERIQRQVEAITHSKTWLDILPSK